MIIKSIMVIDDSEADQFLASSVIEEFDPQIVVFQTYDGQEALNMLEVLNKQPDVIFLDVNMPVMNGHEFLEIYSRQENRSSIIIMLTTSDHDKDREQSGAYDCVKQYINKPLEVTHFEAIAE